MSVAFNWMPKGDYHTLLLTLEGGLLAFGDNTHGQLGLGHEGMESKPPVKFPWHGPQPVQVVWGMANSLLDAEGRMSQALVKG